MERLTYFRVENPNLNTPPLNRRLGKRRYIMSKNVNSSDFQITADGRNLKYLSLDNKIDDPYIKLQEILKHKNKELESIQEIKKNLSKLDENNRKYMSPQPRSIEKGWLLPGDYRQNISLRYKNAYFSKAKPKIIETNPIIGYSVRNPSPERKLASYGNYIFNSSFGGIQ